jgi:16S rRNA (uracil1498-N3)-methyltransferase
LAGPTASRAHAFVDDLARPVLSDEDRHHLARVLRVRPGDTVTVSDGRGGWRECRFGDDLEPAGDVVRIDAPSPRVRVGFAPTKGDRPEWAVQKLVEAGVDEIVLVQAARSVVRWEGERGAHHVERLRRVAREAAVQSRRAWLPEVRGVVAFADAAAADGVALAALGGGPPSLAHPFVLVGPEGGWAPEELAAVPATVTLGGGVLRTETAAVAAAVLLAALRDNIVRPVDHGEWRR